MAEILTEQLDELNKQPSSKHHKSHAAAADSKREDGGHEQPKLGKGVVLDKEGKPCRTCVSLADWRALMKGKSTTSTPSATTAATSTTTPTTPETQTNPPDCPPDVETLGRSTWTLLHSMTATYPTIATPQQQNDMRSFLSLFSKLYPCWVCADDFRNWMNEPSGVNKPRLRTRQEFGNWMCEAHNEVNRKLGKKEFDCKFWEERWRTGWRDGRCD
ncbi:hypothetical protein AJ79_04737 [Helicocarpus griseus UAMH5409]|uniref:Sulfhydryl oxidase n=1 Tax=Helicocarpus griseus UAMH5409 TaxID=1447875 RepID=A0A2B7XJ08_9EURO|nr:hypothetical protein AJ79_04737 [Helicocarpus griseus UAMH5409]